MNWRYLELDDLGLTLDLRWADLSEDDLESRRGALGAAVAEMAELEAGAIANPDEGRQVGHYWLRAPDVAPDESAANAIREAGRATRALVDSLAGRFESVVHIGIGGSALGPQLVVDALVGRGARDLRFADNTDPEGVHRTLEGLDLEDTLVVVVSKSGRTAETRNGYLAVRARLEGAGLSFPERAVAITGAGSELGAMAAGEGWLGRLPMWDWVGGRTSVTSAVGLMPMMLAGIDAQALLDGAAAMDRATRLSELEANPAALMALAWHARVGRDRALVVLPYRDRLALLARYLQQLVMESLGKRLDRKGRVVHEGLTVYGNKGSTDQHAYVQQLRDGPADFVACFVEVLTETGDLEVAPGVTMGDHLSGFLAGTRRALAEAGRPSLTLTLDRVDAERVGALLALFERTVGLYASLVDLNAYHQPGVEAGKVAAGALLALQERLLGLLDEEVGGTAEALARRLGPDTDARDVFHVLRHLAANGRVAVSGRGLDRRFEAV